MILVMLVLAITTQWTSEMNLILRNLSVHVLGQCPSCINLMMKAASIVLTNCNIVCMRVSCNKFSHYRECLIGVLLQCDSWDSSLTLKMLWYVVVIKLALAGGGVWK